MAMMNLNGDLVCIYGNPPTYMHVLSSLRELELSEFCNFDNLLLVKFWCKLI